MKIGSRETPVMLEWFNLYLAMGAERSLLKLSQVTNKSVPYLGNVSSKFGWQARLEKIEREAAEKGIELTAENLAAAKARKLKIIRAIDARFSQRLSNNNVQITPTDFERNARLELHLRGQIESSVGINNLTDLIKESGKEDADGKRKLPAKRKS